MTPPGLVISLFAILGIYFVAMSRIADALSPFRQRWHLTLLFQPSFHGALGIWDEVLCSGALILLFGWLVVYMIRSGRQPAKHDKVLQTGEDPEKTDPPP